MVAGASAQPTSSPAPLPAPPEQAAALLLESARYQHQLAESAVARLHAHADGLDAIVREELRRTFVEECGALVQEAREAGDALARLKRQAGRRLCWSGLVMAAMWSAVALLVLPRLLPAPQELRRLQSQRERLLADVRQLQDEAGQLPLQRCGPERRLCVQVDRRAAAYGAAGDYLIVQGH